MSVYRLAASRRRAQPRSTRRLDGVSLLEATIALTLTGAIFVAVAQMAVATSHARRAAEQRLAATQEAANVMERMMAQPWEALTPEKAAEVRLSPHVQKALPSSELHVKVSESTEESDAVAAKRIHVQLRWRNRAGDWRAPVVLTAWKHQTPPSTPESGTPNNEEE